MRRLTNIVFALLTWCAFTSQTTDQIREIQKKCEQISQESKLLNKRIVKDDEQSTDGGIISGYYKGENLQLISADYLGENGKSQSIYFFANNAIICLIQTNTQYNRPYYWNNHNAKENNDIVSFDDKKATISSDTFYFIESKLTLRSRNKSSLTLRKQQSDISLEVKRLRSLLK